MEATYHYDSRDHHQPFTRSVRFVLFALGLLFVAGAMNFVHLYLTHWSSDESGVYSRSNLLILGVVLALLALLLVVAVVTKIFRKQGYDHFQYIRLEGDELTWRFTSRQGDQTINLQTVKYALSDPRHLIFKMEDGAEVWLENYLLIDPEEWDKFLPVLRERITVN